MKATKLECFPLSLQQKRLWSWQQKSQTYSTACTISIEGLLDKQVFDQALHHVVQRHEILRTFFSHLPGIDIPVQSVVEQAFSPSPLIDMQTVHPDQQQQELEAWMHTQQCPTHSDITQAPLVRSWLVRLAADRHIWLLSLPALCADTSTLYLLSLECQQLYDLHLQSLTSSKTVPDEPLQYVDVSSWQEQLFQEEEAKTQLLAWQEKDFGLLDATHELFEQHHYQQASSDMQDGGSAPAPQQLPLVLDDFLALQIKACAERYGVSQAVFFLAVWQAVLWRLGTVSDFMVGVACDGRTYEELHNALGLYTRFVPIEALFAKDLPFEHLMKEVALFLQEASEKQLYFTWESASPPSKQTDGLPFFPICFEYTDWPITSTSTGLTFSLHQLMSCQEPFWLKLHVVQSDKQLQVVLHYDQARVAASQARRITSALHRFLSSAVERPGARAGSLPILWPGEQEYLLKTFQAPTRPLPEQMLHHLFEASARQMPQNPALIDVKEQLTYQEVNASANQLAHLLRSYGVRPGIQVGLCLHRSAQMIVCMLAILKAGGTYVPLDPTSPPARLKFQLEDSQATLLLTRHELHSLFSQWSETVLSLEEVAARRQDAPTDNLDTLNQMQDIAYIMYTSGSTGMPKGVAVRHQSVTNYTLALCEQLQSQPGWQYATVSTLAADLGNTSIFCALASGGCLHVLDYETITSGDAFAQWVSQHPVDVLKIVPSHLSSLLAAQPSATFLPRRALLLGGEVLPSALLESLWESGCACSIYNHYGPTEATIGVLVNDLGSADTGNRHPELKEGVPLGRPIVNSEVYVCDRRGQLVPIGVTGELYIGGVALADGYVQQPSLTAERFVPHPFSHTSGSRLYRTGDLARYRADGMIEYVGRQDEQVKLRGYRVEPGEVAGQLLRQPGIREAAVQVWQDEGREALLVAYIVPEQKPGPSREALQQALAEQLPEYMLPAHILTLERLPLTANGKVDRQRLPLPEQGGTTDTHEYAEAFLTPIEEILADIWKEVLGLKQIGRHDDFFQVGGHSLSGTRVIARLRTILHLEVPIVWLFEAPTIAQLARRLDLALHQQKQSTCPDIEVVPRTQTLPLSFAQQRLWFLQRLHPESSAYNVPAALRLQGRLHVAALYQALHTLIERHESLRTSFVEREGEPMQQIAAHPHMAFPVLDLSACSHDHWEPELHRLVTQEAGQPFDLARDSLCRTHLLKLGAEDYVLLVTLHHIISDGWSISILVRELSSLYRSRVQSQLCTLPDLPIQYADYASWQRRWLQGEVLQEHIRYWTQQLSEAQALELPADFARSKQRSMRGARLSHSLDAELTSALLSLSQAQGMTLFMTLLTAFQVLLSRLSGQNDIVVGTDSANRSHLETEGLIGFFVNLLALRTHIAGRLPFIELLQQVRETVLGAYTHRELPFETVVEHLRLAREGDRVPLITVLFVMQNVPPVNIELPGISVSLIENNAGVAKFDLALFITEGATGLNYQVHYNADLFREATIVEMMKHYEVLLRDIIAHPESPVDDLDISTEEERQQRSTQKKKRLNSQLSKLKSFKGDLVNLP